MGNGCRRAGSALLSQLIQEKEKEAAARVMGVLGWEAPELRPATFPFRRAPLEAPVALFRDGS